MMEELNFKELDLMINLNNKKDLLSISKSYGSDYVSECVYDLYYHEHYSTIKIARILEVIPLTILNWMKRWGMDRRGRKSKK